MTGDDLVMVPFPPLVATLLNREHQKGAPLTEEEVLAIRDDAECIAMPRDVAAEVARNRGYDDIDLENAWNDWKTIRPTLTSTQDP